jgi:hypothetical protein
MRLEKRFEIMHQGSIAVLLEGFNLLNRANVRSVTDVAGPNFGTPTTYFSGRELQVGIRYLFGRR